MKKSYTLLITIILVSVFSYLCLSLFEIKSLRYQNLSNQHLYIQANNHKEFMKNYLQTLDLSSLEHLKIEDENFNIYAIIKEIDNFYIIDIYVNSKEYSISIHEQIKKENI
ncbi:hypothetical protein [Poseidonibacter sp.]|uniref:hypothetical protein n=1 Tax=Poseidonibacter sp. TaxID=2321188 RepID=UPI003C76FE3F